MAILWYAILRIAIQNYIWNSSFAYLRRTYLDLFMRAEQAEEEQKNTGMLFKIQSYESINNSEYHENWPVSMFTQIPKTKSKPDSILH